jgi:hypothetical protein
VVELGLLRYCSKRHDEDLEAEQGRSLIRKCRFPLSFDCKNCINQSSLILFLLICAQQGLINTVSTKDLYELSSVLIYSSKQGNPRCQAVIANAVIINNGHPKERIGLSPYDVGYLLWSQAFLSAADDNLIRIWWNDQLTNGRSSSGTHAAVIRIIPNREIAVPLDNERRDDAVCIRHLFSNIIDVDVKLESFWQESESIRDADDQNRSFYGHQSSLHNSRLLTIDKPLQASNHEEANGKEGLSIVRSTQIPEWSGAPLATGWFGCFLALGFWIGSHAHYRESGILTIAAFIVFFSAFCGVILILCLTNPMPPL